MHGVMSVYFQRIATHLYLARVCVDAKRRTVVPLRQISGQ